MGWEQIHTSETNIQICFGSHDPIPPDTNMIHIFEANIIHISETSMIETCSGSADPIPPGGGARQLAPAAFLGTSSPCRALTLPGAGTRPGRDTLAGTKNPALVPSVIPAPCLGGGGLRWGEEWMGRNECGRGETVTSREAAGCQLGCARVVTNLGGELGAGEHNFAVTLQ